MVSNEFNFDGLVGATHNYAGLSRGNIASTQNKNQISNPRAAALQGLEKMKYLADRGYAQGVLPPLARPDFQWLRALGFRGNDKHINELVWSNHPELAVQAYSASNMWVANAATVTAANDSADGRCHFTAANLSTMLHRSLEPPQTARILTAIFADEGVFAHHPPLPAGQYFSDEGAANHTRFCANHSSCGVNLFVYNRSSLQQIATPSRYPARQTLEASQAIARQHNIKQVVFAMQNPKAVDQGVFHNDVIAVGCCDLLFCHELAFLQPNSIYESLQEKLAGKLHIIEVKQDCISVERAVATYLFNSQLLYNQDHTYTLVAPSECERDPIVKAYLDELIQEGRFIKQVIYVDLAQSMQNGGGPACLRLRVVLTDEQVHKIKANVLLNDTLYHQLRQWIQCHYRDRLTLEDFRDPLWLDELKQCFDALTQLLKLGSIYPFQKVLDN